MVRIYRVNSVPNYNSINLSFKSAQTQTNPQITELPNTIPDFSVKTPIKYSKIGEMNFPYDTKAYFYKLANGQKVVIVPLEGETVLRTYVNTGSMNEPDNLRGISHYIEHNLFNGSEGLKEGDFFKQVNKMGASTNASTGFGETNYYISSNLLNESDLENKIKLHASMLETPLFAVEKLEKEKGIVNSEINMITSNPINIAVNKMLKNLYGIKTTSADMIGGTTDNITNLSREDVVNYYENNYYPANMVTVVTGNVNPDDTMKLISKYFTSDKQPSNNRHVENLNPIQKTVREDIISDKATASSIVAGFDVTGDVKERIYLQALARLLSNSPNSRIDKKLKEFNTGSVIRQEKMSSDGTRAFIFMADSTEENSEKVLKTFFTEIANIANNPPSDAEMKIIKKYLLKNFSDTFEMSFAANDAIGTSVLEGIEDSLNSYEQIVNSMTAQDLVDTAKKYLDINKVSVTVVHPSSATEESIKRNYQLAFTGNITPIKPVSPYNLNNNYRVILQNSKTNNADILFKLGIDKDYITKPSASLVLSEILNEGSAFKDKENFDNALAEEGIEKGFYANERAVGSAISCDSTNISTAMKALKEVIEHPRFEMKKFEQAKSRIKDAILTSEKSAFDKLDAELFKGLPDGYTKDDILKSLDNLSIDDVKNLYNHIIQNAQGSIAISAPFDKNPDLKNIVFSEVSQFPGVKEFKEQMLCDTYKPTGEIKVLTDTDFKNQAEIVQAYKFPINGNLKDKAALQLLNIILGGNPSSRLFTDLREKEKLAYHVRSNYSNSDNTGIFTLKIETTTENKETGETSFDNVKKSLEGFKRHINLIKSEKVSEDELNNAKLSLKNSVLNSVQTSAQKNTELIINASSPYGIYRTNEYFEMIDTITADDILNAAKYVFSNKPVYSILATENTLKANQDYLLNISV